MSRAWSRAPERGWPTPGGEVAVAAAAGTAATKPPAAVTALKLPGGRGTGRDGEPCRGRTGAGRRRVRASDELYNVIGFNENSNDLTPAADGAARPDRRRYRPAEVPRAGHRLFEQAGQPRHQRAVRHRAGAERLGFIASRRGCSSKRSSATGGGATEQFGDAFSENRRVVISARALRSASLRDTPAPLPDRRSFR